MKIIDGIRESVALCGESTLALFLHAMLTSLWMSTRFPTLCGLSSVIWHTLYPPPRCVAVFPSV